MWLIDCSTPFLAAPLVLADEPCLGRNGRVSELRWPHSFSRRGSPGGSQCIPHSSGETRFPTLLTQYFCRFQSYCSSVSIRLCPDRTFFSTFRLRSPAAILSPAGRPPTFTSSRVLNSSTSQRVINESSTSQLVEICPFSSSFHFILLVRHFGFRFSSL